MDVNRLSSISKADTLEKIGEFWDHHDFTEFDTDAPDVEFEIVCDEQTFSLFHLTNMVNSIPDGLTNVE